jgi:glycosyltransferase involved in cell wall biosynthesis
MISVVIPALNEEKNLGQVIVNVVEAAKAVGGIELDIIVVNDGSTDGTRDLIEGFQKQYSFIRAIHHPINRGIGASFLEALEIAKGEKITIFPGDNDSTPYLMRNLFQHSRDADVIIADIVNRGDRPWIRYVLSRLFTSLFTATFGIDLKYINGNPVYPVSELRRLRLKTHSYSFLAEINVKLLLRDVTYLEVEGYINKASVKTSAFRLRNVFAIGTTYFRLLYEIYFKYRSEYRNKAKRARPSQVRPAHAISNTSDAQL